MDYGIKWDKQTRDFLRKIDKTDAKRIVKKVNNIVGKPLHYLETLVDINSYKLRIGKYRALIDLDEKNKIVHVLFIGFRKNIYKNIKK